MCQKWKLGSIRVERDRRDRMHVVVPVEEEQLDARRLLREEGEVHSPVVDGRAERLGRPRSKVGRGQRLSGGGVFSSS